MLVHYIYENSAHSIALAAFTCIPLGTLEKLKAIIIHMSMDGDSGIMALAAMNNIPPDALKSFHKYLKTFGWEKTRGIFEHGCHHFTKFKCFIIRSYSVQ